MILQLREAKSGASLAMYPSSVVQTGVKSFGWENRIAQPLPIQSWKLMVPCVVSAVKFGASSLMRSDIGGLLAWCWPATHRRGSCDKSPRLAGWFVRYADPD